MDLTYLGTAMLSLEIEGKRLLTDPALDPKGTKYDFGFWYTPRSWFASEKTYETPAITGVFDAVLLSHDHHADNLDFAGRKLVADRDRVDRVVSTVPSARRLARAISKDDAPGGGLGLGGRAQGLLVGQTTRIGAIQITAMPAQHGPWFLPQVHEVTGFLLDVDDGPRIWISGDTVLTSELRGTLDAIGRARPVDVAIVHCGAVSFPRAIGVGSEHFTFDASEVIEACELVRARTIVPVHRSGWAHFRQPENELVSAFDRAGLAERVRLLALGDTFSL